MYGTSHTSLSTVEEVHVVVVVTVSVWLKGPATTILKLLRDLIPIPIVSHPTETRCAITRIHFKSVETWHGTKSQSSKGFPETCPFNYFSVFVDDFAVLKVQSGIRIHAWCLNERLELITRVSGCSFNTENALDGLLSQNGIPESVCNVREFLIVTPVYLVLVASVVIVMCGSRSVFQHFLVVELLGLREPGACGFSPSVIVFEEAIVEMSVGFHRVLKLIKALRDVTFRVEIIRPDLSDVKVNQVTIVAIKLKQLITFEACCVDIVLDINVLMR